MSTLTVDSLQNSRSSSRLSHFWLTLFAVFLFGFTAYLAARGYAYYSLPIGDRPFHPEHPNLRPGGTTGIRLGLWATVMFILIYLYPLRKKFKILRFIGSTKNILNYHIVMGLCAPFVVAMHSAFKFRGIAGVAFWIMLLVVLSGVVGRYIYAQIPRTRKDSEFSLLELQHMSTEAHFQLETMEFEAGPEWDRLMTPVSAERVNRMSLLTALLYMFFVDIRRPFLVAALRRRNLSFFGKLFTLGGLLASTNTHLENAVRLVRTQSWLSAKIFFLDRAAQIFHLWHVIHRPFSLAFLVMALLHIGMVAWMGFLY